MAPQYETRKKNRKKRKLKQNVGKLVSFFRNLILAALLLIVVFCGVSIAAHYKKTQEDIKALSEAGLYHLVELEGGRKMNAVSYGNEESEYVIVPIADIGVQNFSVYVQHLTLDIKDYVHLAFVDRAGYGFSDDTSKKQTVEQIVNDYRAALKAAGIEGPYILLAHEFGGIYATYWEMKYPDEISGIMYLDGTIISKETKMKDYNISTTDRLQSVLYRIGIQRIMYHDLHNFSGKILSTEEANCSRAFNMQSLKTNAQLSELSLMKKNFETVLNIMEKTDIPKLYLSSSNAFRTEDEVRQYYEYKNEQNDELGKERFYDLDQAADVVSEDIQEFITECTEKYETETTQFVEALGNCALARIPGDAKIYEQKPEGIEDALIDFVWYMHGSTDRIKEIYEDTTMVNWKNYSSGNSETEEAE